MPQADAAAGSSAAQRAMRVGDLDFRQMYVNGEPQTRARGPENPSGFSKTATGYTVTDTSLAGWKNRSDVEVVRRTPPGCRPCRSNKRRTPTRS
jgi:hypothetical protein